MTDARHAKAPTVKPYRATAGSRTVRWAVIAAAATLTFTGLGGAALANTQSAEGDPGALKVTSESSEELVNVSPEEGVLGSQDEQPIAEDSPSDIPEALPSDTGSEATAGTELAEVEDDAEPQGDTPLVAAPKENESADEGENLEPEEDASPTLMPMGARNSGDTTSSAAEFTVKVTPKVQCKACTDGFTLTVEDKEPSDDYFITGIPEDWTGTGAEVQSVEPLIYKAKGNQILGKDGLNLKPPAGFEGELSEVQVLKPDSAKNLITDFDNGTFNYLGTAKPQIPSANMPHYAYHDPTVLNSNYYSPMDGYYSVWPTSTTLGPGPRTGTLYNNKWADFRSITTPLPTDGTYSSSWLWGGLKNQAEYDLKRDTRRQPIPADVARDAGKILVVNGKNKQVLTTTVAVDPGSVYLFTGYFANSSFDNDGTLTSVQIDFRAQFSGEGAPTVIGTSSESSRQAGWSNADVKWTSVAGYLQPKRGQNTVTLTLNNHRDSGYGNDFVVDQLELHPMTPASAPEMVVKAGTLTWQKVDENSARLGGSSWRLTGPNVSADTFVSDCVAEGQCGKGAFDDMDHRPGHFKIEGLSCGEYKISESEAPPGYDKTDAVGTGTIKSADSVEGLTVDLGKFENKPKPGSVAWTKVDEDGETLLAGTSWTLTGPSVPNGTVVKDCVAEGECGTGDFNDQDPKPGKFKVGGLKWGQYSITEKSAPEGYEVDATTERKFPEITAESLDVNINDAIQNKRQTGSVEWGKVNENGDALKGSEWQIDPENGEAISEIDRPITDCVADAAEQCFGSDKNPEAGEFKVEGLKWGKYTLTETKAPVGYVLDPQEREFTISATQLSFEFSEGLKNVPVETPPLPLTGGLGTDTFLLLGGGLIAAAGIGGLIYRRRSLRS